ncbi:hypothetical protein ACMHYB_35030 [Sorangium sp. So ce1128]
MFSRCLSVPVVLSFLLAAVACEPVESGGGGDIFVVGSGISRLDATAAVLWTRPLGVPVSDLIISPLGAIAISGAATAPLDFGAGPIAHAGGSDAFVAAFIDP